MDLYRDIPVKEPAMGNWSKSFDTLPYHVQGRSNWAMEPMARATRDQQDLSRRAFYATITHIDHQIRVILGYLRENGLLHNTIIAFTSDHGHFAGEHGLWSMGHFYEMTSKIPLIIVPPKEGKHGTLVPQTVDSRIAEFGDLMPTLLDLADVPIPETVDLLNLADNKKRNYLYGEHGEGDGAQRMIRKGDYKLLYFAKGNRFQLFNITEDPEETNDIAEDPAAATVKKELKKILKENIYGEDSGWITNGEFTGIPAEPFKPEGEIALRGQRGLRFM